MDNEVYYNAKKLWDYYKCFARINDYDKIIVCGSYDIRVCQYAIDLHCNNKKSPKIIFSGNTGNWTRELWSEPEAVIFQKYALKRGIERNKLAIEEYASNLGENICFSQKYINIGERVLYITKPNTLLRLKLTLEKQLPDQDFGLSAPDFEFPEDVSRIIGIDGILNEIVGDFQRICEYPKLGFQNHHSFPDEMVMAYKYLISAGYTSHLMKGLQV